MKNLLLAVPLLSLTVCAADTLVAQPAGCDTRENMVEMLQEKFGEHLFFAAISNADQMLETFVSDESGTWTTLTTYPDGVSCHLADGEGFFVFKKEQEPNI